MTEIGRCAIDHRSLVGDAKICEQCSRQTRVKLAEIPPMWIEAGAYLTPGRDGSGSGGSRSTFSDGIAWAAMGFRQAAEVLGVLQAWEIMVCEEAGVDRASAIGSIQERVEAVCMFLLKHSRWLSCHDAAPDWVAEVANIHGQGEAATRKLTEKLTRIKCPTSLEAFISEDEIGYENCGSWLTLGEGPLDPVECKRCGREWTTFRLVSVILSTPDIEVWLPSDSVASILQMKPREVVEIVRGHRLRKKGKRGEELYDLIAVNTARHAEKGA